MSLRPKKLRYPHKKVGDDVYVYVASGWPTVCAIPKLVEAAYPGCKPHLVKSLEDLNLR